MAKNKKNSPSTLSIEATTTHESSFSGPIPPPALLAEFDLVHTGTAKAIVELMVSQSEHRQDIEKKVLYSDVDNAKLGLIFAFVVSILGLLGTVLLGMYGHEITGSILGGSTFLSLVSTFIYGSKSRRTERKDKDSENNQE